MNAQEGNMGRTTNLAHLEESGEAQQTNWLDASKNDFTCSKSIDVPPSGEVQKLADTFIISDST
jgi:hypothetical protein